MCILIAGNSNWASEASKHFRSISAPHFPIANSNGVRVTGLAFVLHVTCSETLQGDDATPRAIQKLMNVEGLTREQIASRLQKHRQKRKLQSESPQLMSGCEGWDYNGRAPRRLVGPIVESAAVYKIASQAAQGIPTPVYPATCKCLIVLSGDTFHLSEPVCLLACTAALLILSIIYP